MKATVSLFCPTMPIKRIGLRHYRTAEEPMQLSATFDDGTTLDMTVTIPQTDVDVHLMTFPDIAVVRACSGDGHGSGAVFHVDLHEETVSVEIVNGQVQLVAQVIDACPATLTLADGSVWIGKVDFPASVTKLFDGVAAAVTATGVLDRQ